MGAINLNLRRLDTADRREVYETLERLTPRKRLDWLAWCCRLASSAGRYGTVYVTEGDGSMGQVFADLALLEMQYGLDFGAAAEELIRRVRRQ